MAGSRQEHGFTISDRTVAASRPSSRSLGVRLGVVVALAVIVAAVCAASASAVIVEGPGGKRLSYEPLAGASQAPAAGAVPQAATSVQPSLASPECYPDSADNNCAEDPEEPLFWDGGPVMPSTTTYFIYWDPKGASAFPAGYESGITTYFKGLAKENGSDQNQYSILTQYYGESGTPSTDARYETHFGKAIRDKDPYPAEPAECAERPTTPCIDDAQIGAEIGHLITTHKLPPSFKAGGLVDGEEPHIAYFVLLPPSVSTCGRILGCSGVKFCAYHSDILPAGSLSNPSYEGPEVYAVQPYVAGNPGCDSGQHPNGISDGALSGGMVHEFAEMITDPLAVSWLNRYVGGEEEVADICVQGSWAGGNKAFEEKMMFGTPLGTATDGALYNQVVDGRDYYYQQLWSNETNSCQQRRGLPPTVTKLAPAKGSVAGGKKVKITGLYFENPTVTAVDFGKVPAKEFTVVSPTSLTAVSPPATGAGPVEVTLTTSAGTNTSTAADQFTYETK